MNRVDLAKKEGVTVKRLSTISDELFGKGKEEFDDRETAQVKAVIEYMRKRNEASVRKAVYQYLTSASEIEGKPNNPRVDKNLATAISGEGGISQVSAQLYDMAKTRAIKQAVQVQEVSQILLAEYLENGIPLEELSEADLEALEVASEKVYDAALGKYDAVGNYLPALAQPAKMLSAAID